MRTEWKRGLTKSLKSDAYLREVRPESADIVSGLAEQGQLRARFTHDLLRLVVEDGEGVIRCDVQGRGVLAAVRHTGGLKLKGNRAVCRFRIMTQQWKKKRVNG